VDVGGRGNLSADVGFPGRYRVTAGDLVTIQAGGALRGLAAGAALWLLGSGAVARLEAQGRPLSVNGGQDLAFGMLFPGVPSHITRTDVLRSGQFQVTGAKNSSVQVTFTLPPAMLVGSRTVPMQFGAADGGVSTQATIGSTTAFDPRVPLLATLSQQGRLYLFLGGTALPGAQQPAGSYAAPVTVSVCYVGVTC
jgi:hypothetical protein